MADLIEQGRTVEEAGKVVGWSRATTYRRLRLLEKAEGKQQRATAGV